MSSGLLDTGVWIAGDVGRPLNAAALPDEAYVCVVTLAELQAGVLAAPDTRTRAARLATVERLAGLEPLAVDSAAARHWASLRVQLHEAGRSMGVNDLWIAAVALANGLPVVTQDSGFDVLAELGAVEVIRV
ncbi:type II toxin-antitoxin system VapC family toxin [Tessaracoccus lapidicaptus]|uniref:type II toxin-antitoxin system VapC family toxin n=1 Tax=Tessaracoccus lapidicaptus TaxID=1427523 RepID=UPI00333FC9C4